MHSDASKAMHIIDKWEPELPSTHVLVINRTVELTSELNYRIATIGNGSRFMCYASTPGPGYTIIEVAITQVKNQHLAISKLRDIIFEIAETLGVPGDEIVLELEGRMAPVWLHAINSLISSADMSVIPESDESVRDRKIRERRARHKLYRKQSRDESALSAKSA